MSNNKNLFTHFRLSFGAASALLVLSSVSSTAFGERGGWYPSPWGANDERGAANLLTNDKVLQATKLIKEGRIYQLGRVYEPEMPLFGDRTYQMRILEIGPLGKNNLTAHEGYFSGELDQGGTQFDGLGHIGVGERFFNGYRHNDLGNEHGLAYLGVENVGPIFTRGILIDLPGYKGVEILEGGYEITAHDLKGALEQQGTEIHKGDVVLIHTGWGSHWKTDNSAYLLSEPGIGMEAAQYLVDRNIVVVGSDNLGIEVVPNPNGSLAFPVHQLLLTQHGIYLLESIITEELANDDIHEFAFFFAPLRLKGASGSPGNPVAIH